MDADELLEVLAAVPDLVALVGRDRTIRYVNRYEAGYEAEEVLGRDTAEFVAPDAREEHIRRLDGVFESGEPAEELTEVVARDGGTEWWQGIMVPIEREGRVVAVAVVTRNVTAQVEAEKEVELFRSLLPICSWCNRVRSDDREWQTLEAYLEGTSHSRVTHGMCPDCARSDDREWQTLEAYLEGTSHSRVTHGMCPDCARKVEGPQGEEGGSEGGGSTRTAAG